MRLPIGTNMWHNKLITIMKTENTYLYLTKLHLLYLHLCWEKKHFSPFLFQSRPSFRLIDGFFLLLITLYLFYSPVHWGVSAYLCILYKYHPLIISYLLKTRGYSFWPLGGLLGRKNLKFLFTLIILGSARHWALFPGLQCKTASCRESRWLSQIYLLFFPYK